VLGPVVTGPPRRARTAAYDAAGRSRAHWSEGTRRRDATSRSGRNPFQLLLFDRDLLQILKLKYTKW
jgi:hypothetical protein